MFDSWLGIMMSRHQWPDGRIGMRADELASALGVSEAGVSRWLAGQRLPERKQVARLAVLFRVNPEVILRLTDPDILRTTMREIEQHDVSAVLSKVPELATLLEDIARLSPERRAALIVLVRALTEG